jgi:hypothetical protein
LLRFRLLDINITTNTATDVSTSQGDSSMPSSSPPTSQSSLYQFYTPIASNDSPSPTSRVLQPSTQQNIPPRSRINVKRGLQLNSSGPSPAKKQKPSSVESPLLRILPVRRHERETLPRGLAKRDLSGRRGELSQRIILESVLI